MKLNYTTLAVTIAAVVIVSQRSHAQEGFAGQGHPAQMAAPMQGYDTPHPAMAAGQAMPPQMMGGHPGMYAQPAQIQMGGYNQPMMEYGYADPHAAAGHEVYGPDVYGHDVYGHEGFAGFTGQQAAALAPRAYGSVDLMYMWRRGTRFPQGVVTTSEPADRGILGQPTTEVLFGGNEQDRPLHGGRITLGLWLDECQDWSIGGRFMGLEEQNLGRSYTSDEFPVLAHPFFNTVSQMEDAFLIAFPGVGVGAAHPSEITLSNRNNFYSGDLFVTKHLHTSHANRLDFLTGYSFARVDESFAMDSRFVVQDLGGTIPVGTEVHFQDRFAAKNEFHGGQFGLIGELQDGPFTWRALGKLSVGNMEQRARIHGAHLEDGQLIAERGIYAGAGNSGERKRNRFAFIPEANIDVLYAINGNLDLKFGTTFIYINEVVTGGSLIDREIDPSFNSTTPQFRWNTQDYWVLGMNFGIDYHY